MKIEWLATNVTPVRSSDRAERDIWRVILGVYGSIQAIVVVVVMDPRCGIGTPLPRRLGPGHGSRGRACRYSSYHIRLAGYNVINSI